MKTIVAISGVAYTGKSSTLLEFAHILLATYTSYKPIFPASAALPNDGDFRLVVEVNGKIIGIEGNGSPKRGLSFKLDDLDHNHHCDIIVCSMRTKGDTVDAVENLRQRGFQLIRTSTYWVASNQKLVNKAKARHLLDLLQQLKLLQ